MASDAAPTTTAPALPALAPAISAQVQDQCRAVSGLCKAVTELHDDYAKVIATGCMSPELLQMVGERTAKLMEYLGDLLNGMDATTDEDAWMAPIFEKAHAMFPVQATQAPSAASGEAPQLQADTLALLRKFVENIATPKSEPLNTIVVLSLRIERQRAMGKLREQARVLLEAIDAAAAAQAAPAAQPDELRRAVRGMAAMLGEREWAEHVSTDPDATALESAITELHGEHSAMHDALKAIADGEGDAQVIAQQTLDELGGAAGATGGATA